MDSSRYGIRLRVEYPEYLETHGRDRIWEIMGDAIAKLQRAAEMSDPASLNFVPPENPS